MLQKKKSPSKEQHRKLCKEFQAANAEAQHALRTMQEKRWSELADERQNAVNSNNTKQMYYLMKQAFDHRSTKITSLRTEDSNDLHTDIDGMAKRWKKHFDRLLNMLSNVDPEVLKKVHQRPIAGKCSAWHGGTQHVGIDGLPAEIFCYGGIYLSQLMHDLTVKIWIDGEVPKDWRDATIIPIYKGKGAQELCGNYKRIALLSLAGKILACSPIKIKPEHS